MKYTIEERVFLVKTYYESYSITHVQRAFSSKFPKSGNPSNSTINKTVSNFEKYGSIASIQKKSKQKREEAKK